MTHLEYDPAPDSGGGMTSTIGPGQSTPHRRVPVGGCEVGLPAERDGAVHVALTGELDLVAGSALSQALTRLRGPSPGLLPRPGCDTVLLDLSDLHFLDISGLRALIDHSAELNTVGWRTSLVHPQPQVRWLIDWARLSGWLPDELPCPCAELGAGRD